MQIEAGKPWQDIARGDERLNGVYTSMPEELPPALRDRDIVIAGGALDAALQFATGCASLTYITARTSRIKGAPQKNVRIHYGSEIVCVDGVEYVESVVVRKRSTGAITACSAAALFLLAD